MKKTKFKIMIIFLICFHLYATLMIWIYWMLDYNYGDIYRIRMASISKESISYEVIKNLYNEILFDIYYFAIATILTITLALIYVKKYQTENKTRIKERTYYDHSNI